MRRVGCALEFDVTDPATLILGVTPSSSSGALLSERLDVTVDGRAQQVEEISGDHGSVMRMLRSPVGRLQIYYEAALEPPPPAEVVSSTRLDGEQLIYLRPSRYCPSDVLSGFAAYELGHLPPGPELLAAVSAWVASRLTYVSGSSDSQDTAIDSLLAGRGVCRDFAHLGIAMLRALEVPARLVSVYAPGLTPMDFHAVIEAHVDGRWQIVDPTRSAPRHSMVRVSTGRDAADTALVTVLGGDAELQRLEVTAVTDGALPIDDHTDPVALA